MIGPTGERPDGGARLRRLALLAVVALGIAPGTFVRTATGFSWDKAVVTVTPRPERAGGTGALRLTGAWQLESAHGWFGGFSTLAPNAPRPGKPALIAGTDAGYLLDIDLSGASPRAVPGSFRFVGMRGRGRKESTDLESLARDPATGTLWGGFEYDNLIVRFGADGRRTVSAPAAMAHWGENTGPETMERLADGRFLVIAEGTDAGSVTRHEALLFPGDPVAPGAQPAISTFEAPADYDPVDAAQLPDGRLLILMRRVRYFIPARFDTAIGLADPRDIRPGARWQARIIERLEGGIFADNFEGIAFVPSPADPAKGSVWLIVDDNFSVFQRSLLIRFDWPEAPIP